MIQAKIMQPMVSEGYFSQHVAISDEKHFVCACVVLEKQL